MKKLFILISICVGQVCVLDAGGSCSKSPFSMKSKETTLQDLLGKVSAEGTWEIGENEFLGPKYHKEQEGNAAWPTNGWLLISNNDENEKNLPYFYFHPKVSDMLVLIFYADSSNQLQFKNYFFPRNEENLQLVISTFKEKISNNVERDLCNLLKQNQD